MNGQAAGLIRRDGNRILPPDTNHSVTKAMTQSIDSPGDFTLSQLPILQFGK